MKRARYVEIMHFKKKIFFKLFKKYSFAFISFLLIFNLILSFDWVKYKLGLKIIKNLFKNFF